MHFKRILLLSISAFVISSSLCTAMMNDNDAAIRSAAGTPTAQSAVGGGATPTPSSLTPEDRGKINNLVRSTSFSDQHALEQFIVDYFFDFPSAQGLDTFQLIGNFLKRLKLAAFDEETWKFSFSLTQLAKERGLKANSLYPSSRAWTPSEYTPLQFAETVASLPPTEGLYDWICRISAHCPPHEFENIPHFLSFCLEQLSAVSPPTRNVVVHALLRLPPALAQPRHTLTFFVAPPFPHEAIDPFVTTALSFEKQYPGALNLPALAQISPEDRETFLQAVAPFMKFPGMAGIGEKNPDKALATERQSLLGLFAKKFPKGTIPEGLLERITLFRTQLSSVVKELEPNTLSNFTGYRSLVSMMIDIPAEVFDRCVELALQFAAGTLHTENSWEYPSFNHAIGSLLEHVYSYVLPHPKQSAHYLRTLFPKLEACTPLWMLNWAFDRLNKIQNYYLRNVKQELPEDTPEDLLVVAANAQMDSYVQRMARVLSLLPVQEKAAQRPHTMETASGVVSCLDYIPPNKRATLFELPLSFCDKIDLIASALQMVAPQHRAEGYFVHVFSEHTDAFWDRIRELGSLKIQKIQYSNVSYKDLVERIAGSPYTPLADLGISTEDIYQESYLKNILTERTSFRGLERHWLDAVGQEIAGINVHSGEREKKTTEALLLLIQAQEALSQPEVHDAVEACRNYIQKSPAFTDNIRTRALCALEGKAVQGGFDSLLSQMSGSAVFAYLDGPQLVARLWRFADTYQDPAVPNDAENARQSLVRELAKGADSDGFQICNLGKVQHVLCGSVQGRLPGVAIDDLPKDARVLTNGSGRGVAAQEAEESATAMGGGAPATAATETEEAPPSGTRSGKKLASLFLLTLQEQTLAEKFPHKNPNALLNAGGTWLRAQGGKPLATEERKIFDDQLQDFFTSLGVDD